MNTAPTPAPSPAASPTGRRTGLSAAEFVRCITGKVFDDRRRVELWDRQLVDLPEPDRLRVICRGALTDVLSAVAALVGGHVRVDDYLRLADRDVPRPDIMVVRGHRDADAKAFPTPADVALVVEVVVSAVPAHLERIAAAYAAGGVPSYWQVDLSAGRIEAFADPTRGGAPCYRRRQAYGPGRTIPVALPGGLQTCDGRRKNVALAGDRRSVRKRGAQGSPRSDGVRLEGGIIPNPTRRREVYGCSPTWTTGPRSAVASSSTA